MNIYTYIYIYIFTLRLSPLLTPHPPTHLWSCPGARFNTNCLNHAALSCTASGFSLYKILFQFKALLWNAVILSLPLPPLAKPTLLQCYCTPIAQYTPPHRPPFCMPNTMQNW